MAEDDRWRKIEEIFHAAVEQDRDRLPGFLAEACAGDDDLRREVESLLACDREAADFLETPAVDYAAWRFGEIDRSFVGQLLGNYRVVSRIGSGGMGEVYLAEDTRLGRRVALKVLARELSSDTQWRARFAREAKAASALNHPNIITVFDVGREQGRDFLVMELVAGNALEQLIGGKPMPLDRALQLAAQVADALAAAHAAGIVHRDVKPGNIMVTGPASGRPGLVKVLDFGVAKLTKPESEPGGTHTLPAPTREGAILGTAAYMSPEQAEGRAVDARSDVFSFGAVLYEMLTGRRAFPGESIASTLAAILNEEPAPLPQVCPGAPRELERIVQRCLRKDPARRFQTMQDVKIELDEVREELASPKTAGAEIPRPRRRLWYAVAAALLAAGAFAFVWLGRMTPPASMKPVPFTAEIGDEMMPDFSPDGKQVVFVATREPFTSSDLFIRTVDSAGLLQLTNTAEWESSPAWSPDGRWIAFVRGGKASRQLLVVPSIGGPERKIVDDLCSGDGLSWSADSRWLACSGSPGAGLSLISADSGESRRLTSIAKDAQDLAPSFSPDGRSLLFVRCATIWDCDLYLLAFDSRLNAEGEPRLVTTKHFAVLNAVAWSPDGREAICGQRGGLGFDLRLFRVPILRPGRPQELALAGPRTAYPAVSRQGTRLVYAKEHTDLNIWRSQGGGAERHPVSSTLMDTNPGFSPDGQRVVFTSSRSGTLQIWIASADGSQPVQLTHSGTYSASPRWSPDGRWIAYDRWEQGRWDVWIVGANGGASRQFTSHPSNNDEPTFSRDGKWIYFNSKRTGRAEVYRMPFAGGKEEQITKGGGSFAQESADGKTIYYALTQGALSTVMEVPVAGGEERSLGITFTNRAFQVMSDGIYFISPPVAVQDTPPWSRYPAVPPLDFKLKERGGLARTQGYAAIQFYDFATATTRELGRVPDRLGLWFRGFSVSPDRKTFLYSADEGTGWDLMLVENFR